MIDTHIPIYPLDLEADHLERYLEVVRLRADVCGCPGWPVTWRKDGVASPGDMAQLNPRYHDPGDYDERMEYARNKTRKRKIL